VNEANAYVVREEVLRLAMDEALLLNAQSELSEYDHGARMAYFSILNRGILQADQLKLEFGDRELQAFDPYSVLRPPAAA
jgi:hypothetical protein